MNLLSIKGESMLHFSFSAVLMAVLGSSLIASVIAIAFFHEKFLVCIGYKFPAFFTGLALLRLLLPFELPFTHSILLPRPLSRAISFFRQPGLRLFGAGISLWNLLEIVWMTGIIVNLVRYIANYRFSKSYIQKYGIDKTNDPKYREILDSICFKYRKNNRFHIMELPQLDTPALWGPKTPHILLPDGFPIPSDKLYYVLYHEALHCFRHDFVVKSAVHLLSIIYWWNPAYIILRRHSYTLLEMCIDGAISQDDPDIVEEYVECLLYMRKAASENMAQAPSALKKETCPLIQPSNSSFKKRILMLLTHPPVLRKACANALLTLLILCVFAASYLFIPKASYEPPGAAQEALPFTGENSCFVKGEGSGCAVSPQSGAIVWKYKAENAKVYKRPCSSSARTWTGDGIYACDYTPQ